MKTLVICSLLFIITASATAIAPPAIEWEELYSIQFADVIETQEGNLICAGWEIVTGLYNCVFCFDADGNEIWEYNDQTYPRIYWTDCLQQLSDGTIVTVGIGYQTSSSLPSLAICKLTKEGDELWTKVYELADNTSRGFDFTPLPDGGFAICGDIDPAEGMNQAWILRTDALGDTLWTREWGWDYTDRALKVLFIDNGLTVLIYGRLQGSTYGTYLVRYDLDGNLLWETGIPELSGQIAQDMCEANDGGLFILDNYVPSIYHTDYYGHYEWHFGPPGAGQPYGWTIDTTMDGGIIYGGENADNPPNQLTTDLSGMISRHDSLGNELWRDYVYNSGCQALNSVRQLSQGGYIAAGAAAGSQGILLRYAPETGIEHENGLPGLAFNAISPNPISSTAAIDFSLLEAGEASLTLYDLNGRVVSSISDGSFSEGNNTINWNPAGDLSSGCYLLMLSSAGGNVTRNVVLLR